ncbi:MAG: hypothetical protein ACPLTR_01920 [Thermacetogeniaceae bacterium]
MDWIKLHRELLDSPIFRKPELLQLWLYPLLSACHEQTGQLVVGYETLANKLGYPKTYKASIRCWLKKLEEEGYVQLDSSHSGTIVTIRDWFDYKPTHDEKERNNTIVGLD